MEVPAIEVQGETAKLKAPDETPVILGIEGGGTGATTAEEARSNLGAAPKVHEHVVSDITDFPSSMPASDVKAWAKADVKPSYTYNEVGAAPKVHEHVVSDITDFPSSMPASDVKAWAKADVKPSYTYNEVGAAPASHTHSASNISSGTLSLDRIPAIPDSKLSGISASKISGIIPSANLPSFVDDVLEFNGVSNFPGTGETGKIYVDTSTNKTYRWGGSSYVEISASLAIGTTSSTAFRGDLGNQAYIHAQAKGSAFPSGIYKITTNAQGHVTNAVPIEKSDIVDLGIPSTNTTYNIASQSASGLMSSSDKTKLDGIATGANKYVLPTASSSVLGGIKTGYSENGKNYPVELDSSGKAFVNVPWTDSTTPSYSLPAATPNTLGGVKTGYSENGKNYPVELNSSNQMFVNVPWTDTNTTYSNMSGATTSAAGKAGLVPAPSAGSATRYLRSDGSWAVPPDTNTTYTLASFGITATAAELNKLDGVTATATELNYVDGVTSNIQTQLNGKMKTPSGGTTGQILTKTSSGYGWANAPSASVSAITTSYVDSLFQ